MEIEEDNETFRYDPAYFNALRELKVLAFIGGLALIWTIACSALFGQRSDEAAVTFGMPSWIFWAVFVPWVVTGLFTIGFACFVMREDDDDLVDAADGSVDDDQGGAR